MNLKALQEKLAALLAESDAIAAKSAPSTEDIARIQAIPAEMREAKAAIEAAREIESIRAWQVETAPTAITLSDPNQAPAARTASTASPATVEPAVKLWAVKRFGEIPSAAEQIAKELYGSLAANGDYSQALYDKNQAFVRYVRTGAGESDPIARAIVLTPAQIVNLAAAGMSVRAVKANMVEGSDELGGFVTPEDFREGIVMRLPGMTVVRPRANVLTTSRDVLTMARVTGGNSRYTGAVRVSWVDEEPTATEAATNATFGQLRISIFTTMAHTQVSKNLLEDAMMDVGGYLSKEFSEAIAIDEDEQFLINGTAGRPQGVLNGTAANGGVNNGDVTEVNSGAAAALTGDGLKKVPFAIAKQYRSNSAVWIMNKATVQASALLKDGNGRYLYPQGDLTGQAIPESLLGYAIAESEAMPDVAANVDAIIFGDLSGYLIADRVGMSIQRYDDSTTAKGNAVVFIARRRVGGQVTEGWRLAAQKIAV